MNERDLKKALASCTCPHARAAYKDELRILNGHKPKTHKTLPKRVAVERQGIEDFVDPLTVVNREGR